MKKFNNKAELKELTDVLIEVLEETLESGVDTSKNLTINSVMYKINTVTLATGKGFAIHVTKKEKVE